MNRTIRLNQNLRSILRKHVQRMILPEVAAEIEAKRKDFEENLLIGELRVLYPPEDMRVLTKYEKTEGLEWCFIAAPVEYNPIQGFYLSRVLADSDRNVWDEREYSGGNGGEVFFDQENHRWEVCRYYFRKDSKTVLVPSGSHGRILIGPNKIITSLDAYQCIHKSLYEITKLISTRRKEHSNICAAYNKLIQSCKTVNQLVEIWPEAENVLQVSKIPIAYNPELDQAVAIVQQDMCLRGVVECDKDKEAPNNE